jgi:dynein heavy chain, axonemal
MTPQDLGWRPIVQSFLPRELPADTPEPLREHIMALFLATVDEGLAFRSTECSEPIPTTDAQAVTSLCRLFVALIREFGERPTGADPAAKPAGLNMTRPVEELRRIIDSLYAFAYVWSIGGSIASDCYDRFDAFLRGHKASILGQIRYGPGTVFENFPDISNADAPWRRWSDVVPSFAYDREQPYFAMVVPTIDTVRFSYLLTTQLSQLNPVFFTGVTGTGKTVIVQDFLNRFSSPDLKPGLGLPVAPVVINFSARTSSMDTQMTIEAVRSWHQSAVRGVSASV